MTQKYDAVIIGAGHNGLVTAAYLAQKGNKVLVVERRDSIGGAAATEAVFPEFRVNTGAADVGLFLPEIIADLDLKQHGLEFIESPALAHSLGNGLTLWRDQQQTVQEIARFSTADAEKYPAFVDLICRLAAVLQDAIRRTPPTLPEYSYGELFSWAPVGLKLKRLGKQDMVEFLRILPMSVEELLDNWFESPALKGALAAAGVTGTMQGPYAAGTVLMLLYNGLGASPGSLRASRFVRGGTGALSEALAQAAGGFGAEIRTGTAVSQILTIDDRATGILLENGEQIEAKIVVSNANPRHTFFKLIGAPEFEIDFNRDVKNIKYRGSTARINLALRDLPNFEGVAGDTSQLSGHLLLCPDLGYLERAYDDAKYGRLSTSPALDIVIPTLSDPSLAPDGQHLMSVDVRYAPYHLRHTNWDETLRDQLSQRVIDLIAAHAPNIKDLILHQQVITPLDYETDYGLPEGSIYHGQMGLDQMFIMRPIGGYARYQTPFENLYLCGAGTHPGGGVTGAPGYNAAREILQRS